MLRTDKTNREGDVTLRNVKMFTGVATTIVRASWNDVVVQITSYNDSHEVLILVRQNDKIVGSKRLPKSLAHDTMDDARNLLKKLKEKGKL